MGTDDLGTSSELKDITIYIIMMDKKERKNEYNRLYRLKNLEKERERCRLYKLKNKDKIKIQRQGYSKTINGKKSLIIAQWKHLGILCFDWDLLYDIYVSCNKCEFCDKSFKNCKKNLDHDHSITEGFNIRGVLCSSCNVKDVLKK